MSNPPPPPSADDILAAAIHLAYRVAAGQS
jgi:hypothetical protein